MANRASGAHRDALRFLIAGGVNTAVTSAVYLLAAVFLDPTPAYAIAWCIGLLFVGIVYPDKVFRGGRNDLRSRVWLVGSTVLVFGIGILTLRLVGGLIGVHQIAFLVTLALTTCLNFGFGRLILRRI